MRSNQKSILVVLLALVSGFASAADTGRYTAYANTQPIFRYADAVAERPLLVNATSDGGDCHFTLAFVGYQQGNIRNISLTGRIENGECHGQSIGKGFGLATVTPHGDNVQLDRFMQIVILE